MSAQKQASPVSQSGVKPTRFTVRAGGEIYDAKRGRVLTTDEVVEFLNAGREAANELRSFDWLSPIQEELL